MNCPECEAEDIGLGLCYSCGFDAREKPERPTNSGQPITRNHPPSEVSLTLPWDCLASDNLKTRRPGGSEAEYRQKKEAAEARLMAQAGPGRPLIPDDPLRVALHFYPPDNRRRDPLNYAKMLMDAMTGIIYGDDSQAKDGTWAMHEPVDDARCEVEVHRIETGVDA